MFVVEIVVGAVRVVVVGGGVLLGDIGVDFLLGAGSDQN